MNRIEKKNIDFFNKYFPTYNKVDKSKLQITTEGIYSVSGVAAASFISKVIFKIFKTKFKERSNSLPIIKNIWRLIDKENISKKISSFVKITYFFVVF